MRNINHYGRALAVRGQLAGAAVRDRVAEGVHRRVRAVHTAERGAQAAEYAMLGGVSAAACGALIKVCQDNPDIFRTLLSTVVNVLNRTVRSWF